ncbi:hypothetical protein BC834DRAFT_909589 [Gloeopeniophorella convolvens]|nr:hypothetical protein BC834DRAFT_909589 [Gloeopeniophorella convolvens]
MDWMLDKGFENDIRAVTGQTLQGAARRTLMSEAVRRLAGSFPRDPMRITVGSDDLTANSRVVQAIVSNTKDGSPPVRILSFALYKNEAMRVEGTVRRAGYAVGALHGDMVQSARMDTLQRSRDESTRPLVTADMAARRLDILDVGCVLNRSFPLTVESYVYRVGRTGAHSMHPATWCFGAGAAGAVLKEMCACARAARFRFTGHGGKGGRGITFFMGDNHERASQRGRALYTHDPHKHFGDCADAGISGGGRRKSDSENRIE